MDPLIDDIKRMLKGRDFRDPDDAVILLECLSVVVDDKIARMIPAPTLEAALRILEAEPDPEFQPHRRAWAAYLRGIPRQALSLPDVTKN
jgi:hypothetical protein